MRFICVLTSLTALAVSAGAASYTIKTVVGGGMPPTPMAGTSASVQPESIALDSAGDVYFSTSYAVFKMTSGGILTRVAGAPGGSNKLGDGGAATSAYINGAMGIALDSAGNLYIADAANQRIRKVTAAGKISTVAGNGTAGYAGDGGTATNAELNGPMGVAVDAAGNLYIADSNNNRIRKVANGKITTVAGNGTAGYAGNGGPALSAELSGPTDVAVDSAGDLYIADCTNNVIRKVAGGTISTVAGGGSNSPTQSGAATSAMIIDPWNVALDSAGNLYITAPVQGGVLKVSSGGTISVVAGTCNWSRGYSGDGGPATSALLSWPEGIAVDASGELYIGDNNNFRLRKVGAGGVISTAAGNGTMYYDGAGSATKAQAGFVPSIAVDSSGDVYFADPFDNRIRMLKSSGAVATVAGNGVAGFSGDSGAATSAELNEPEAIALDPVTGDLYIADSSNYRIRKVSGGTITTVAGTGAAGYGGDNGPATSAELGYVLGLAVDTSGDLFIADTNNYRVRKVSGGTIATVAGNGTAGFAGDGGPATSAELYFPAAVFVNSAGTLFFSDLDNLRVRTVSGGTIQTIAGNGTGGYSGDGAAATSAQLAGPRSIFVNSAGDVYFADSGNYVVRELVP